jgi:hypothetical protein
LICAQELLKNAIGLSEAKEQKASNFNS